MVGPLSVSQEELATFVQGFSAADAAWYSVTYLHEDIPSLSRLLRTSETNLQSILVLLGLGSVSKSGKFLFQKMKFDRFVSDFQLEDCEVTQHNVKDQKSRKWFIRLGRMNIARMAKPGTRGVPPRVHFVESLSRNFKNSVMKLARDASTQAQDQELQTTNSGVGGNNGAGGTANGNENDEEDNLVIMRLRSQVIPLLLTNSATLQWRKNIDAGQVEMQLQSIVREANEKREEELSLILSTVRNPVSPQSANRISFCPTLKQYGVSLEDRRLHGNVLRDLMSLNKKFEKGKQANMISYQGVSKGTYNLVAIPRSTGYGKFCRHARETNWVSNLLFALGGDNGQEDTLLDFLSFLSRSEAYRDIWEEGVRLNGYPMPTIDEVTTKAIQSMANINREQMRQLRSCLRTELGSPLFATEYKISQIVNLEYEVPVTGTYKYGSERIPWSYKSVVKCFKLWMKTRLLKDTERAKGYKQIDICINLDHGKGHSRISANFISRFQDSDGGWHEESYPCALGNARCLHDNAEIILKTFGVLLDEDLISIQTSGGLCITTDNKVELAADTDDANGTIIPVELFLASDILLYAIALGKEGSAGWWCTYCKLKRDDWQAAGHARGRAWTIEELAEHAGELVGSETARERMGVKTRPVFESIPISHYITPILHITIGKGNDILTSFIEEMQAAAEGYTDGYIEAQKKMLVTKEELGVSQDQLASFLMHNRDYISDLKRQRRRTRTLAPEAQNLVALELESLEEEMKELQDIIDSNKISQAEAKKQFEMEQRQEENSKAWGQPIRAKVDEIMYNHGIDRSAAFGGKIDGNDCRRLMANADTIVGEVMEFVLTSESKVEGMSDDLIRQVCEAHKFYLQAFDGYLSGMITKRYHLTDEIAAKTGLYRDKCLELERYLQLSITPKSHIVGAHSCEQQVYFKGIGDLDESFGERNHQHESIADRRHGGTRDFALREKIKAKEEAQFNHPGVQDRVQDIKMKRKRNYEVTKSGVQETAAGKRQRREEARAEVLNFIVPASSLTRLRDERKRLFREGLGTNNTME
jgi:hypothetical protein